MHEVAKKKEGGATITHNLYLPSCKNEIINKILASTKQKCIQFAYIQIYVFSMKFS